MPPLKRDDKDGFRTCKSCNLSLPLEMFGVYQMASRIEKTHRRSCKKCRVLEESARYHENPDLRKRASLSSEKSRLKNMYGITVEEYQEMFKNQNGKCFICDKEQAKLNIDHDHKTGKVRGLLCWNCNTAIGKFKDSVALLEKAIEYLKGDLF